MAPSPYLSIRRWRGLRRALLALAAIAACGTSLGQGNPLPPGCGAVNDHGYGPYDYRDWKDMGIYDPVTGATSPLAMVEGAHFIESCEALIRCKRGGAIGADLSYTLGAFPNHHRALVAMMRYGENTKRATPPDARYSVDCYFKRAIVWRPDDTLARLIYVTYLNDNKRLPEAKDQVKEAARRVGDNPFTLYNLGMVALDVNEVDVAVEAARQSYGRGMPRPQLRERLQALGRWSDELATPIAPAASAASAARAASAASAP